MKKALCSRGMVSGVVVALALAVGCAAPVEYDVVLRNGTMYDGSGSAPYLGDLAMDGDLIAAIGDLGRAARWQRPPPPPDLGQAGRLQRPLLFARWPPRLHH